MMAAHWRIKMARDRFYEARMQGMIYAFNKAKEEGIEALERDMKKRKDETREQRKY